MTDCRTAPCSLTHRGVSALRAARVMVGWVLAIWLLPCSGTLAGEGSTAGSDPVKGPVPEYRLRIPNDISVLPAEETFVEVPLLLQHNGSGPFDVLRVGLDYDELLLRFHTGDLSLESCMGTAVEILGHDPRTGLLQLEIVFDPLRGIDAPEPLVRLGFTLGAYTYVKDPAEYYSHQTSASIQILEDEIVLGSTHKSVDSQYADIQAFDGGLNILLRDHIALGSAEMSPDTQVFAIPVYVTHLREEFTRFELNVDYDMAYFELIDVLPSPRSLRSPASGTGGDAGPVQQVPVRAGDVEWLDKSDDAEKATIAVRFTGGVYPRLKRYHLLDLHFLYREEHGVPRSGRWTVTATPGGAGFDVGLAAEAENDGSFDVEPGIIHAVDGVFLRGDADTDGRVDIRDAIRLLDAIFRQGYRVLSCLDAADANDSGYVDFLDAVDMITFVFGTGPAPKMPFPEPGSDITDDDALGCESAGAPYFRLLGVPSD